MVLAQFKRILVPLDGSKNSFRALNFAIYLARNCGATITGIFILERTPEKDYRRIGSVEKYILKEAKEFLEEAKFRCAQKAVVFKDKIGFGDPGFSVVKFAENNTYNVIVIGSRGRSVAKEVLLGSVSNYVIHKSKLPVILIK